MKSGKRDLKEFLHKALKNHKLTKTSLVEAAKKKAKVSSNQMTRQKEFGSSLLASKAVEAFEPSGRTKPKDRLYPLTYQ